MVFFFNDTATTEIYTLSLHDALPTSAPTGLLRVGRAELRRGGAGLRRSEDADDRRGVADLPGEHPLHRLVERHPLDGHVQLLVLDDEALRPVDGREPLGEVDQDLLAAEAGGAEAVRQQRPALGGEAGLLGR